MSEKSEQIEARWRNKYARGYRDIHNLCDEVAALEAKLETMEQEIAAWKEVDRARRYLYAAVSGPNGYDTSTEAWKRANADLSAALLVLTAAQQEKE